ncbi:sugar ABC transporter ATP-binding protein [Bacillus sp. V3B]|uniref:sugar ABC transporter ATP-binding protein n=1 Tax=Bacillus sp. V3B TaxID=2804915 RepID=UPI0021098DD9|nr:sugar ABC transporter ATP-binding protein [Bacillus sp. V3B]MCQ6277071.1 sugar ABC transporter ATP-binding protein [Bacillus sp. V3B]
MTTELRKVSTPFALEINHISKFYPGVVALNQISMNLEWGTIHGIAGENGSGKSTLLKVISGMVKSDQGEVIYKGLPVKESHKHLQQDVAMVTQEPSLVNSLSVSENISIGGRNRNESRWLVSWKKYKEIASEYLEKLGVTGIDLNQNVEHLSPDKQQLILIARALASNPKILLLDEATSSLSEDQTLTLFTVLDELKANGLCIIFISHRLKEYLRLCDRVTVLRDSNYIGDLKKEDMTEHSIVTSMVGREMEDYYPPKVASPSQEEAIAFQDFSCHQVRNVSFLIKKGEIFVLAGLDGCGRSELLKGLFGVIPSKGKVEVYGEKMTFRSPREAIDKGFSYIPGERKSEGIIAEMSIMENAMLSYRSQKPFWRWIEHKFEKEKFLEMKENMQIKAPTIYTLIKTLSGGNQQKVVLARALALKPKFLLLEEPTRGIDVGAKAEIYKLLRALTTQGVTVIVSTSELPEAIGIADRIGVMFRGSLQKILHGSEMSEEKVMYFATGN